MIHRSAWSGYAVADPCHCSGIQFDVKRKIPCCLLYKAEGTPRLRRPLLCAMRVNSAFESCRYLNSKALISKGRNSKSREAEHGRAVPFAC